MFYNKNSQIYGFIQNKSVYHFMLKRKSHDINSRNSILSLERKSDTIKSTPVTTYPIWRHHQLKYSTHIFQITCPRMAHTYKSYPALIFTPLDPARTFMSFGIFVLVHFRIFTTTACGLYHVFVCIRSGNGNPFTSLSPRRPQLKNRYHNPSVK